ncbi:hypothetical protein BJG93_07345 [Paraburkholderia sprentiae WSM5005]|uniref:Cellulose biosynthesis protein BcsR n=1 Tax=Paraburkholderia sprentiae WSM5005 TaxID=754502 RepID=A0A1I9YFY7_9BURK|nr:hypothetical protein [Paraburkholderia sprentiae]APA85220.1 hypothetical protein BJG93_07345 [Paraburkholderia sprentiae WSM5005]
MTNPQHAAKDAAHGAWPVDDISGLALRLPEVEPRRYFDAQAKEAYQESLLKWPVLARLMNLVPRDEADVQAARGERQASALK